MCALLSPSHTHFQRPRPAMAAPFALLLISPLKPVSGQNFENHLFAMEAVALKNHNVQVE